jgi:murein L,D-transpeptidase YafK
MIRVVSSILILTTTAITSLSASSLVDEYRLYGEKVVLNKLEKQLQSKEYWKSYFQDKNIEYGYSYKNRDFLVCSKNDKTISLVKSDKSGMDISGSLSVITGEKGGDKQVEGDLKTPIGTYNLIEKKEQVDKFYGPLAFVTSYPNLYDRLKGKTGSGIWIHGMPIDNEKREEFTKGCIALDNKSLLELSNSINYKNTILLISENMVEKTNQEEMAIIMSNVYSWRAAWKDSNVDKYLNFYDNTFKRFDGRGIEQFSKMKRRIFKRGGRKTIIFSNFEIVLYPNVKNERVFKVTFDEDYRSKYTNFKGKKELYVKLVNNSMKILAEK